MSRGVRTVLPFPYCRCPGSIIGEDLEIRGELSSRLAYGLQEYERIQHLWKPDIFKPIGIKFRNLSPIHPAEKSEGVVVPSPEEWTLSIPFGPISLKMSRIPRTASPIV